MNRSFIARALFVADGVRASTRSRSTPVPPPGCRPMDGKVRCVARGHRFVTRRASAPLRRPKRGSVQMDLTLEAAIGFGKHRSAPGAFASFGAFGKRYGANPSLGAMSRYERRMRAM